MAITHEVRVHPSTPRRAGERGGHPRGAAPPSRVPRASRRLTAARKVA